MSPRARQITTRVLVVLASVCIVLALLVGYVRRAVVDSDQFANRATVALRDDSVRSLIAEKVTDEVVLKQERDLIAARPIIESVASTIVGSRAFTSLFRTAVRDVHRALFDRDRDTVTLTVSDVGTVLAAALETAAPVARVAGQSRRRGRSWSSADLGSLGGDLARVADDIRLLSVLLLIAALLLIAGALLLSPDRRRTVIELGIGAAAGGVAADRRLRGRAPDRDRPGRWTREPGRGGRRLGRVSRGPAHGGLDPGRVRSGRRGGGRIAAETRRRPRAAAARGRLGLARARASGAEGRCAEPASSRRGCC